MLNGPQLHLMLNHLPIVGFILLSPIMILVSMIKKSEYKRLALLATVILGLLTLPAYLTGEPAEESIEKYQGVYEAHIEEHEEAAELALFAALITSGLAAAGWLYSRRDATKLPLITVLLAGAVLTTSGLMVWVGHLGGKIRHPEIRGDMPTQSSEEAE